MAHTFNFEINPILGDATVIDDEMAQMNSYDYVIYDDNIEKGGVHFLETNDELNSYYVAIEYESNNKDEVAELIDDLRLSFQIGRLFGIDIGTESCIVYFSTDYETVRLMNLLGFEPSELFYRQ